MATARHSHLLSFDNLSRIDSRLSDAICRLSTGGAFTTRKLHTDSDLAWFQGARPIILNGIPMLTERADLADRSLQVRLLDIGGRSRQTEAEWWTSWHSVRPNILGVLFSALSVAIRRIDTVKLELLPRMADFVRLVEAAAPGLGWEDGAFSAAYAENRSCANDLAFEADPVAVAIHDLVPSKAGAKWSWEGTATELLATLNRAASPEIRRLHPWPKKANEMGNAVLRAKPSLRQKGILVDRYKTAARRLITISLDRTSKRR
ncbi:hypothetical protein CSC94_18095 [Zhengella mangrovi]|uniref:Uncharacterized protein n=1 Tax=Zhengella mangrovi TaxID=1982044 RepID=A0A2G1QJ17_9HYPH|nr:hypothetical protein [Zhengella mangrovi]PHP65516.1 hypothetical protein CSC94_18095 [Zhengella mangrovi]